ncbi:MAG: helix-turn-helix transcriptional regulator [Clostridia bacterium]|nr:helix-turn-helix transcriptional regulator [Clostridia bacterium]MBQ8522397.1 helix-turn-helix transcriptional regulator [Clostridia bacterium]
MEKKKFGQFIKESRIKKGLTQKELADLLFIDVTAVSKWERGVSYPDITLISSICKNLDISEKELIESSNDSEYHKMKSEAKKWRTFSMSWSLFFYISYAIALIPCFICDLAINKGLTWFWIVLSALLLAFTFTNLPKHIKKHRVILIPLSMLTALYILLGVCCIYTKGDWFLTAVLGVLIGYVGVFYPIVFYKTKLGLSEQKFTKFKKWFLLTYAFGMTGLTLLLLVVINWNRPFNLFNGVMITLYGYTILAVFGLIGLIKTNAFTKIGLGFLSILPYLFGLEKVLYKLLGGNDGGSYYDVDFSNWSTHINGNVLCIIHLSGILFLTIGLVLHFKRKKQK